MTDAPHDLMPTAAGKHKPATTGRVLHSANFYDLVAWLFLLGREPAFRRRTVDLARLTAGESVLDVGCGTGTLAILAKRRVGPTGAVFGIDASREMIARAARKARQAGADVAFETAVVEALPFPDERFDVVLSTLMLHHLPRPAREQCARELRRVSKQGGRVLVVDFGAAGRRKKKLLDRLHRHGRIDRSEIVRVLTDAGLRIVDSGALGIRDLQFVLASVP